MKILLAHNFYQSSAPSGEDAVYLNERQLLIDAGHEVVDYTRSNDDLIDAGILGKLKTAYNADWSRSTFLGIGDILRKTRPDIAHFHNTFPLISPSAYAACRDQNVPVVQTLHNYRLICPGALLQRHASPCEDCVGRSLWPAVAHRCYRESYLASAAVARMLLNNRKRGSYSRLVNRYIALTRFAASRMAAGGLEAHRISIKPNYLPNPPEIGTGRGGYAIYVGRLSAEKGLRTLLKAWRDIRHLPLRIAGDGPLMDELKADARAQELPIDFLGYCSRHKVLDLVRDAVFQVVPSEWYEGFPMVILEAYACGTPVLAAAIGSLDEIVIEHQTGWKFSPGSARSLIKMVSVALDDLDKSRIARTAIRQHFDDHYTGKHNYAELLAIYKQTLAL